MFRRIGWQVLLVGLGFVLTAGMLVYFAATYTTEFRPAPGGTYVESVSGYPQSLNPLLSYYNDADSDVVALVFSGLTRVTMNGEVAPDLATGWEIEPGGITYTFHLNPRALWHDGTPVSADDVVFTVGLMQDPDYPGPPDIGALWQSVLVERVDELSVRFTLAEPFAPFLDYTTFGLLPAHQLAGIRAANLASLEFNRSPVGAGPFRMSDVLVEEGQITEITFKRFPRYYGEAPYIENLILKFYPTPRAAFEAYEEGLVEGIAQAPAELLPEAWMLEDLNFYSAPTAEMAMLYFNEMISATVPFDETPVRQALLYGLDRQALIDTVLMGQALAPATPVLPGTWAYVTEEVPEYVYDPNRAATLLAEAGWSRDTLTGTLKNAGGTPLHFTLMVAADPQDVALGEAIAAQWATIGISATVQVVPPLALGGALEARSYEAALVHLIVPGDPDPYPFWHETQALIGQNYAGFRHRRISELIEDARRTLDRDQRYLLYREFQQLFMQEVPAIPLYVPVHTYAVDARISGIQIGPLVRTGDRFRNIATWYVLQRRIVVSQQ
ncbi:MAG: peptide ABC transporter substrate-binding protein [Anaerolineae bacterium]|nr:peptide ABC transporter substrate-binding protein [Anaerolineae bacterium]